MPVDIPTTLASNGPPPADAAALYVGEVMHARMRPVGHRFRYRVANLLIDLDRLAEAGRMSRFFSVGRFNLFSFHEKDHGARDGSGLRAHVDRMAAGAGLDRPDRVLLLCYPRVCGFVFNPISVYFAFGRDGQVTALFYEVNNTFGDGHTYVAPVEPGEATAAGIRQSRDKRLHVSPFLPMEQRYHFRVLPPGEGLRLRILETDGAGPTLSATFAGRRRRLTTGALARVFAAMPFHTIKVVAGIHWEAARLYLKGVPTFRRGPPPERIGQAGSAPPVAAE